MLVATVTSENRPLAERPEFGASAQHAKMAFMGGAAAGAIGVVTGIASALIA